VILTLIAIALILFAIWWLNNKYFSVESNRFSFDRIPKIFTQPHLTSIGAAQKNKSDARTSNLRSDSSSSGASYSTGSTQAGVTTSNLASNKQDSHKRDSKVNQKISGNPANSVSEPGTSTSPGYGKGHTDNKGHRSAGGSSSPSHSSGGGSAVNSSAGSNLSGSNSPANNQSGSGSSGSKPYGSSSSANNPSGDNTSGSRSYGSSSSTNNPSGGNPPGSGSYRSNSSTNNPSGSNSYGSSSSDSNRSASTPSGNSQSGVTSTGAGINAGNPRGDHSASNKNVSSSTPAQKALNSAKWQAERDQIGVEQRAHQSSPDKTRHDVARHQRGSTTSERNEYQTRNTQQGFQSQGNHQSRATAPATNANPATESNASGVGSSKPSDNASRNSTVRRQPLYTAPTERDDLKVIKGIGKVMEKTLNDLGVTTFKQLGNFKSEDISRVSDALEVFPGRIERDEWVPQARIQYQTKYGKQLTGNE